MSLDPLMDHSAPALDAHKYDQQWRRVDDFIHYHPGARHRRRLLYRILKQLNPRSVCDVGCGNGELLALMQKRYPGIDLYGVDLSPEVVDKNRHRYPTVHFEVLDVEHEGFRAPCDVVICSEVVEHLNNRAEAIRNLLKGVKPGGHLVVTAPAGPIFETERRWGHTTHPTVAEFEEHARMHNCDLVHVSNWGFPTYYALKIVTNLNPDAAMRTFGDGSYSWPQRVVCGALYYLNFLNLPDSRWGCQLVSLLRKRP